MSSAALASSPWRLGRVGSAWPLVVGYAALALPTLYTLAQQDWSRESGAHGPIVIATGAWLLARNARAMREEGSPGSLPLTLLVLTASLVVYMFGRAFDFMTFEAGGLYGVGLALMHSLVGLRVMRRNWFPLFYLAFAVPPPQFLIDGITAPLKHLVSLGATNFLSMVGFPISREGVILYIAQYELLVEDACSGMNSLIGLTAIGLFYVYMMRGSSWRRSLLLTLFVLPIAIFANLVRIMTLVLVTYFFGNEAAQGFIHEGAGVLLFVTALLMVFLADTLISLVLDRKKMPAS